MDQSTPAAARDDEVVTQGVPGIADDPFIHHPTHETNVAGHSPTFVLPHVHGRRQMVPPRRRGTVSHPHPYPHQRSHDRSGHHSQPSSPQGLTEADDNSTLCMSPVSGDIHPSPSFSATMPSSPVSYLSSPPLPRTDEEEEQDIPEEDESDGDKWADSLRLSNSHSRERPSRNGFGSHRRSSTGASTLLESRSATLLGSPTPNDSSPSKGSSFLHQHGKLDMCEEAEELSDREMEKLEGSETDDGNGISDVIWPMFPANLKRLRYGFRDRYIKKQKTQCTFKPRQRSFKEGNLPEGWTKIIGPEGFPFFWHAKYQVITDTWIPDREMYERLWDFFKQIQAFTKQHNYRKNSNVHLVLDVHEASGKWWCGYYLVDHSNFSVFWYENVTCATRELGEIKGGEMSIGFMKVFAEWEYWKHWCLFPDLCPTPPRVWRVAQNYIRNAQTDVLTADRPATNYTFEKLRDMMSIVSEAKESYFLNIGKEGTESLLPAEECPWFIGRFMEPLARERFLNFYGEKHARIDGNQSVYGEKARLRLRDTTLAFRILSPLLFCAPEILFRKMELLWVDRIAHAEPWNHFFDTLSEDWAHQLVYASILLTSNIAFLTVPNVTPENAVTQGTFVQIPSYVSTIATIGSIILGLVLNRQHQNRQRSTKLEKSNAEEIHEWLTMRLHSNRGLEPLAVMFSLPYALLMWGMFAFLTSFTLMCLNRTTNGARIFTAVSCFLVFVFVIWFWWMSWDNTTDRWSSTWSTFKDWKPLKGLLSAWDNVLKKRARPVEVAPAVDDIRLESGIRDGDASSVVSDMTAGFLKNLRHPPSVHLPLRKVSTHDSY